jgi:hypothetical protein
VTNNFDFWLAEFRESMDVDPSPKEISFMRQAFDAGIQQAGRQVAELIRIMVSPSGPEKSR